MIITDASERNPKKGGVAAVDRISNLPCNVIDHILGYMSVQDAAKTRILSRKWRYIWAECPNLVLDGQLFKDTIRDKSTAQFQNVCVNLVNSILLQHFGPIQKFVLDIPKLRPSKFFNIDQWIFFVSRKGLKELILDNSNPKLYKLPSYIFSCPELTLLSVSKCIFKVPDGFKGFSKLTRLILQEITFGPSVLNIPQLVAVRFQECRAIHHCRISAPLLRLLELCGNDDLELSHYIVCEKLQVIHVIANGVEHHAPGPGERIISTTFLGYWRSLRQLHLDAHSFKYLFVGSTVPEKLPTMLNSLKRLAVCRISYELHEMACILCLLRSSPNLRQFVCWSQQNVGTDTKVINCLKEPGLMEQRLNRLQTLNLTFSKSSAELLFIKLLLAISPSLERVYFKFLDLCDVVDALRELKPFSRASPTAGIMFQPGLDRNSFSPFFG